MKSNRTLTLALLMSMSFQACDRQGQKKAGREDAIRIAAIQMELDKTSTKDYFALWSAAASVHHVIPSLLGSTKEAHALELQLPLSLDVMKSTISSRTKAASDYELIFIISFFMQHGTQETWDAVAAWARELPDVEVLRRKSMSHPWRHAIDYLLQADRRSMILSVWSEGKKLKKPPSAGDYDYAFENRRSIKKQP